MWRIAAHGEDIVYAVDFNHRKERHLNGAAIDGIVSRPAILITGACTLPQYLIAAQHSTGT